MNWKATGQYSSIVELLTTKSGMSLQEIVEPKRVAPDRIENLRAALAAIVQCVKEKKSVTIIGDYDADGLTSTAILTKLLRLMGARPDTIIPKRFTEGYGLSVDMMERVAKGLVITVDNGIAAIDAIKTAKDRGDTVVVIDHHLPSDELPPADVIVDPHVNPSENGYVEYCGAGLAYKLAEMYILSLPPSESNTHLLMEMCVLAATGTVADMMPLTGDNRFIVKKGLSLLNTRFSELPHSLQELYRSAKAEVFDEETISYKIAPMINAAGRMYNAGGTSVLKLLLCDLPTECASYTKKLEEINETRKKQTEVLFEKVCKQAEDANLTSQTPICLFVEHMPEGLVGLVTGKLAEKYKKPCFVFTSSEREGILKGSGRSFGGFNLEPMIKAIKPVIEQGGGHEGAAGLSVSRDNFDKMIAIMRDCAKDYEGVATDDLFYDMKILEANVPSMLAELATYAPFGQGMPKPVFVVTPFETTPQPTGSHYRYVGEKHQHLQLRAAHCSAIGFNLAEYYTKLGMPLSCSVLGTIGENRFRGKSTAQIMISDVKAI